MKEVKIQVRFNDLDGYGHVNNSVYLSYLEIARTTVFANIFKDFMDKGQWFILVFAEIKYKKFIKYGEDVLVSIKMGDIGGAKFSFEYSVHDGKGSVFSEAKTIHVIVDGATSKIIKINDDIKNILENF